MKRKRLLLALRALPEDMLQPLVWMGMDVVRFDDLSGGFLANIPKGVRFIEGRVNDDSMVRMLTENEHFDYIYHLGAYAAEGLSHFIRLLTTKLAEEGKRARGVW